MEISLAYPKAAEHGLEYSLLIDGTRIPKREAYAYKWQNGGGWGHIYSDRVNKLLETASISSFPSEIESWEFRLPDLAPAIGLEYRLSDYRSPHSKPAGYLKITFDSESWAHPWGIGKFCTAFIQAARALPRSSLRIAYEDELPENGLRITGSYPNSAALLGDEIRRKTILAEEIYRSAVVKLLTDLNDAAVVTFFNFPSEHAAVCKQYLVYFSEFLSSIGVEAQLSIADEAKQVLFSVKPKDGAEALELVRSALGVYLSLPRHKLVKTAATADMRVRGIERALEQFQKAVGHGPDGGHAAKTASTLVEKAEFFGGRLVVKKFQHGPFELDLPKLIDDFKRLTRKLK